MFANLHVISLIFSLAFVYVFPASAQKPARKQEKTVSVAVAAGPVTVITDVEVRTIRGYYVAVGKKPKPLPPGIAKNLARGKKVPPGIMRTRLPEDLVVKLPRREGYEWAIANDVVLLIDATGIVRDILREIF